MGDPNNQDDSLFAVESCARVRTLATMRAAHLRTTARWWNRDLKSAGFLNTLASKLHSIYLGLPESKPSKDHESDYGLGTFMLRLEKLCTGDKDGLSSEFMGKGRLPMWCPILDELFKAPSPFTALAISESVMSNLTAIITTDPESVQSYLKYLESFVEQITASRANEGGDKSKPTDLPVAEEYPRPVNKRLYDTLYKNILCTCIKPWSCLLMRHSGGLRLKGRLDILPDDVVFETLFSTKIPSNPTETVEWRHFRFFIPRSEPYLKKAAVSQADEKTDTANADAAGSNHLVSSCTNLPEFCHLIQVSIGHASRGLKFYEKELRQLPADESDQLVANEPGISLSEVLEKHRLTSRGRIILAYILARSVWQYYGSVWMQTRWTAESILFMKEKFPNVMTSEINASAPYFILRPPEHSKITEPEYFDSIEATHHYPLVLALGILLVEICGNGAKVNTADDSVTLVERINNERALCHGMATRDEDWPYLKLSSAIKEVYKEVVLNCLTTKIFKTAYEIEDRRAVIFKNIVHPLQNLLTNLQWLDSSGNFIPFRSEEGNMKKTNDDISDPLDSVSNIISQKSQNWLQRVQGSAFCESLTLQSSKERKNVQRVRIAILDTGCDKKSQFLRDDLRAARIIGWKDSFGSSEAQDEDGHGTRVLSLAMKIAPMADIYVARIARNSEELRKDREGTSKNVEEAIKWAASHDVDIISMSFGWAKETEVEGKQVISDAILKAKSQKILFFAAASNYGATKPELFPAKHELVTSIRATNDFGTFAEFNAPPEDKIAFGTLGCDVPCAGLETSQGEIAATGTSMATPIAAGLAALILSFARLQLSAGAKALSSGAKPKSIDRKPEKTHKWKALWTKSGMERMFEQLSTQPSTPGSGLRFLQPSMFVGGSFDNEYRRRKIDDAVQ